MTGYTKYRGWIVTLLQVIIFGCSVAAAFALRFEFSVPGAELPYLWQGLALAMLIKPGCFWFFGCDRAGWRYFGVRDLVRLGIANVVASALFALGAILASDGAVPRSIYVLDFLICFFCTAGARLAIRIYHESPAPSSKAGCRNVLIYGAGAAAIMLLREIRSNPSLHYRVLGLLDDDPKKLGMELMGVRVVGRGRDAALIVDRYHRHAETVHEIVIAMPSASGSSMNDALANCRAAGVPCKTIPGVGELLSGRVLSSQIRDVSVEDLLGRQQITLDESRVRSSIEGKSVMVSGGGGSIGSELCRQIVSFHPARLVILERAESDLFRIHLELSSRNGTANVIPVIGDIREPGRVEQVIRKYEVDSIYHTAAYKHVPIMETHILEAGERNIIGTYNLMHAAASAGVADFLMISSDKAVHPSSIMGLTKRVAELIVTAVPTRLPLTKFVCVRFGNVLGSNGSVVPIFRQQIAAGGPVTVTHPEMKRYFMTIREAVQLVLQASTMGKASEIFVLEMGEPVLIVDLARNMIRLSGHQPNGDIEIRFTGLRPGEKLFEELALEGENVVPTDHEKIHAYVGPRKPSSEIRAWMEELQALVAVEDEFGVLNHMRQLVPEYNGGGPELKRGDPTRTDSKVGVATSGNRD